MTVRTQQIFFNPILSPMETRTYLERELIYLFKQMKSWHERHNTRELATLLTFEIFELTVADFIHCDVIVYTEKVPHASFPWYALRKGEVKYISKRTKT